MWNINAPQRRIPCAIFTKFAEFVRLYPFQDALAVKILLDFSKGYGVTGVMGVLSWWGLVTPKFSAPPSGETVRQTPKVLEVQELARGPLSPCLVWWGSPKTLVFLSVCLSVPHAFERQSLCAQFCHEGVGVQKRFCYRWIGKGL